MVGDFESLKSFLCIRWIRFSCENCLLVDGGVFFSEFKVVYRWVVSNNFIVEDIIFIGVSRIGIIIKLIEF